MLSTAEIIEELDTLELEAGVDTLHGSEEEELAAHVDNSSSEGTESRIAEKDGWSLKFDLRPFLSGECFFWLRHLGSAAGVVAWAVVPIARAEESSIVIF